jgi:hypothetical protein
MATKRASQNLKDAISEIAEKLTSIHNEAVATYTPLVNDICNRKATEYEVDYLLTNLLNFIGEQRMFELFKQVCRAYLDTYPEVIGYYIIEYFKNYDIEKAKALGIEIPSYMEDENTDENL